MKDHPIYKLKSVKHDSFDRVHIIFKDGREFFLYPDDIEIASVISHYVNKKAAEFGGK